MKISEIFKKLNIPDECFIPYGNSMAKIDTEKVNSERNQLGLQQSSHLILVTAMSPTSKGEGKTTTTIGLGDGISRLGGKTLSPFLGGQR